MKSIRMFCLAAAIIALSGCGGGGASGGPTGSASNGTGYCRIPGTGTQSTCEDWSTALSQQNAGVGCQASGGQWSGTACSTSGADGYCPAPAYGAAVYYYNYGATLASSHCPSTWHSLAGSSGTTTPVAGLMGGSKQGTPLVLSGNVTTLAGTGANSFQNGTGTGASFFNPYGIATDGTNLYVVDTWNSAIRKIVISTGAVTTLAGGTQGFFDGSATAAKFQQPTGITTDGTNLYVAEASNARIRKIVIATGQVSTLAGSGPLASASIDGTGTAASFYAPWDVTTDGTNLYVVDTFSSKIRKVVIATGVVTTLAPTEGVSGPVAVFGAPYGITTDGTNLYVADTGYHRIRKIVIATNVVTTLAGSGAIGALDGTGTGATFDSPDGLTTDGTNLYVADSKNNTIRKIVISTGVVTTLAGSGTAGSANGAGTGASFDKPWGITTDGVSLYVTDYTKSLIRKIQ